jgi:DNA-directed RNA polymerase specialized sigma24 family protein
LQSLPERARQVFTLRRVYSLSLKEIAAQLGLSEKTVEAHISLALRRCADFVQNADARAAHASELARLSSATLKPAVRHA